MGCPNIPKVPKIARLQTLYIILKKELGDEVDFFHVDKLSKFPTSWFQHSGYQSALQGDTIIDVHDEAFSKYWKLQVCNIFTISQK